MNRRPAEDRLRAIVPARTAVRFRLRHLDMGSGALPSNAHPGQQLWRVVEGETLRWRCWGGDYVVFNPLSGQTHFLDIVTGRILTLLLAGSRSLSEIRARIALFLEVEDDERLASTISQLLVSLEDAGLVERIDRVGA